MRVFHSCLGACLLAGATIAADGTPGTAPVATGASTSVEVRLVTVDVIALDARDRTVPNLTKQDFQLFVDGKESDIDTLDVSCEAGAQDDPHSRKLGGWETPADLAHGVRRVVLAFDYLHLAVAPCNERDPSAPCQLQTQALRAYQDALEARRDVADEETMVVALTGGLRIEQPFTRDREAVIRTLRRMEHDVSLWNGNFGHLTETPLFTSLQALVTVLRAVPGPKAVVLLSAGAGPTGPYDREFDRLASASSDAQVSFYPVDCQGLAPPTGGPPGLALFASLTGGRLTRGTNDFTVGYARARRDLGCRYTIGFYDRKPEEDKRHALRVESRRAGVHLIHASAYSFPSPKERRLLAVQAAYLAPGMYEGGGMRAHVFPVEPQDARKWNALVAVDFPVPIDSEPGAATRREFGIVLARGSEVATTFTRSVTLTATSAGSKAERRLTFLEAAVLSPGRYTLTAVLSDPGGKDPWAAHADVEVPDIPKRGPFLAGPILGRRSGGDLVIYGAETDAGAPADRVGAAGSFRPLLVDEVDRAEPLAALTHVCVVKGRSEGGWRVSRVLEAEDGTIAGSVPDTALGAFGKGAVRCERYLDELPVQRLRAGRYTFLATIAMIATIGKLDLEPKSSRVPFAVLGGASP
jgi:VWFA-related protein